MGGFTFWLIDTDKLDQEGYILSMPHKGTSPYSTSPCMALFNLLRFASLIIELIQLSLAYLYTEKIYEKYKIPPNSVDY